MLFLLLISLPAVPLPLWFLHHTVLFWWKWSNTMGLNVCWRGQPADITYGGWHAWLNLVCCRGSQSSPAWRLLNLNIFGQGTLSFGWLVCYMFCMGRDIVEGKPTPAKFTQLCFCEIEITFLNWNSWRRDYIVSSIRLMHATWKYDLFEEMK